MITSGKRLCSLTKFSQLILEGNVWGSVWRICKWISGIKGLTLHNQPSLISLVRDL